MYMLYDYNSLFIAAMMARGIAIAGYANDFKRLIQDQAWP